jgi:hypothetical protein
VRIIFAWFIVLAELGVLYLAFWLFFVWEPKTYKIKGNPWGNYGTKDCRQKPPFIIVLDDELSRKLRAIREKGARTIVPYETFKAKQARFNKRSLYNFKIR